MCEYTMKIIYCIAGTYNSGGMERVLANKANYLVAQGYEVHIITSDQQGRNPYFSLDDRIVLHDLGIDYCENNEKGIWSKIISYPVKQYRHQVKMRRLLKVLRGDIVISMFDHEVSFLNRIADGSKKILEIHFSRFKRIQYDRSGLWKAIDKWRSAQDLRLARKYDRFIVLTEEDKMHWGAISNIQVIPNANTFESIDNAALDKNIAVAVGRYDFQKGFDDLIRIWAKVTSINRNWILYIYGHGVMKGELEQLARDLGIDDIVRFCPPTADIKQVYLDSSILLMTSRYEGLPMCLLESQACGVPAVVYACQCGPRDIIENGRNGYLVDPNNPDEFVARLIQLMDEKKLRKEMGLQAKVMSSRFSNEHVMRRWLNLFNELKNL